MNCLKGLPMPTNELLNEFIIINTDSLARRMTDLFDSILDETDESATESLKSELQRILEESIHALDEN